MDIPWEEIFKISGSALSVGGAFVTLFQIVFFRKVSQFPIKPQKQFVINYLEKREKIILFLTISFFIMAVVASFAITAYFKPESIGMKLVAFVVPTIIGIGLVLIYVDYILKPLSVSFTRALFISLGYDQEDFQELTDKIKNSEQLFHKGIIYEALGMVYLPNKTSKQDATKDGASS